MAPRRIRRRRRTKAVYGRTPPVYAQAITPTAKAGIYRLQHNFYARMDSVVNPWSPIFLHFGAPMNVPYRGSSHSNNLDSFYPFLSQQHAMWYTQARKMYNQYVQTAMNVRVTFFTDTDTTAPSLVVGVGADGTFANNTGDSFPFDNLYEAANAPYTRCKLLRGNPSGQSSACEAVVSQRYTAKQIHGDSWTLMSHAQPCIAPGIALNTPSQVSNAGLNTGTFGCVCVFAALPFQYIVTAMPVPQMWIELEHEIYFFDPKTYYIYFFDFAIFRRTPWLFVPAVFAAPAPVVVVAVASAATLLALVLPPLWRARAS